MSYRVKNSLGSFLAGWHVSGDRLEFFFSDEEEEAYLFDDQEAASAVVMSCSGVFPMEIDQLVAA